MAGGLLGYALAGAATGAGTGLINEARAKRDAVMEELRDQRLMAREDRQFGRQMQMQDRQFDQQRQRDDTQWERERERDMMSGGDVVRLEDGSTGVRRGGQVQPLTDAEGNPVNIARTTSDSAAPADVRTAEWLISQGVASDPADAWRLVRQARENPASRASLVTQVYRSMSSNFMDQRSDEEQMQAAEDFVDRLMQQDERGSPRPEGAGRDTASSRAPRMPGMSAPPGEGSQRNPYQATTPDHVEWFKENAPAGAVIVIEGERYTKD